MDVVAFTREFVGFNTVSSESNVALAARLLELIESLAFSTEVHSRKDASGREKQNIIGRWAASDGRSDGGLMLAGHMDTVPFLPTQKANLSPLMEGSRLYGRGTCDMKGAIAAQIIAAARFKGRKLKAPLTLAFTRDEEIGCLGAKALLDTELLRSRHVIIGEPSSLKPVRMHKGYCGARITFRGRAAHSSDPRRGISALKAAARAILAIEAVEEELKLEPFHGGESYFSPNYGTVNVGVLEAGVARNVIPEVCTFTLEFRALPGQDLDTRFNRLREVIVGAATAMGVSVDFDVVTWDKAMETSPEAEVVTFLEELTGASSGAVSFSTEGKEYNQMGMESAILGPGSIDQAHQEDEYVPLDELEQAVDLYSTAIERFCL